MREGGGDRRCSVDIFVAVCCEPGVWVLTLGMLWPRAGVCRGVRYRWSPCAHEVCCMV